MAVRLAPALIAAFLVWAFAATVLAHTRSMGLPLDDSYIYLTYAKQFGRAHPFTYFPGGGYSAGSTSVVWPMLLAPFWTLGARGHALVWVSYGLCGVLYAAVGIGVGRFVARVTECSVVGVACGAMAIAVPAFAFCALSGMEVAFASALLVAALILLYDAPPAGAPGGKLALVLAALSLSRPEATLIVAGVVAIAAYRRRRDRRAALRWLVPLAAPVAWVIANKIFAGNLFPNTGVVKSHFYLPGFDWTYYRETVIAQTGAMLKALFWSTDSPLVWPEVITPLIVLGIVRAMLWARRTGKYLVATVAIASPFALMLAVVASSGVGGWSFQNYRYVATAFPLVFVLVGFALAPPSSDEKAPWAVSSGLFGAIIVVAAWSPMKANMLLFAQGASDTNTQVVAIGRYLHTKLPDARVMLHDAGAISYYGDSAIYDMLGLVTNHQAEIANNGPGSRFEFLERLPPEQRPTHFAYYPGWLGTQDFFGEPVLRTPIGAPFAASRLVGDQDMQLIPAVWDHVGTGEAPINDHAGWTVVDQIDVADIDSERAHHWTATLGRRHFGDPTARWSFVDREVMQLGLVIDGGRTIRFEDGHAAGEAFDIDVDPAKPVRLVIRTGGKPDIPFHEHIARSTQIALYVGAKPAGHLDVAPPSGGFSELTFNVLQRGKDAPHVIRVHTEANGPYRSLHWFVLQPD